MKKQNRLFGIMKEEKRKKKTWRCIGLFSMMFLVSAIFSMICLAQESWQLVTSPKLGIPSAIAATAPTSTNSVFVTAEHDGAWISTNGGATALNWSFAFPYIAIPPFCTDRPTCANYGLYEVHISRFLAAPSVLADLYMLGIHGEFQASTDGGNSWVSRTSVGGPSDGDPWSALAIDPDFPLTVLAGGLFEIKRTTDGASTSSWTKITNNAISKTLITDIQYVDSFNVWAATSNSTTYPTDLESDTPSCMGVLLSADGGQTWTQYPLPSGTPDPNCVYGIAPVSSTEAYAATAGGLWHTSNGGTSWSQIQVATVPLNSKISSVFYSVSPTPTLYVGVAIDPNPSTTPCNSGYNGVYSYAGGSWTPLTALPNGIGWCVNSIGGVLYDSTTFFVAYSNGELRKATNSGTTVTPLTGPNGGYPMSTVAIPNNANQDTVLVGSVCQSGTNRSTNTTGSATWTTMQRDPTACPHTNHNHFHYVMRLAPHPNNASYIYATDNDQVYRNPQTGEDQSYWPVKFGNYAPVNNPCPSPTPHLHGLGVYASDSTILNTVLYVGTGLGNWGDSITQARIWKATNGGELPGNWGEVTCTNPPCNFTPPLPAGFFPQPPADTCCVVNPTTCLRANCPNVPTNAYSIICGCFSLYDIAVSAKSSNVVYVATFGDENNPGKLMLGKGIGVVRSMSGGGNTWETINNGLCKDDGTCPASDPPAGSRSLFVGKVAIANIPGGAINQDYVYIATLNGIYRRMIGDGAGVAWGDISPTGADAFRRFESIAVDPSNLTATNMVIYAGTSEQGGALAPPNPPPPARIYRAVCNATTCTWDSPPSTPPSQIIQWTDRFRVRDIQLRTRQSMETTAGYAVVEGAGIYRLNRTSGTAPTRR